MTEQTQPTDAELEACPFCGNANAIVYDDLLTFHAGCLSCGSTGSVSSYRNGAIAAWNRRAVLAKWGTPAGAGEPVMWAFQDSEGRWRDASHTEHSAGMKPLYPTPQPTQAQAGAVPLTSEQERAIREAYESAGSESYFGARPQIDTNDRRRVFKAGFERGWDAKTGADHA